MGWETIGHPGSTAHRLDIASSAIDLMMQISALTCPNRMGGEVETAVEEEQLNAVFVVWTRRRGGEELCKRGQSPTLDKSSLTSSCLTFLVPTSFLGCTPYLSYYSPFPPLFHCETSRWTKVGLGKIDLNDIDWSVMEL